MLKRFTTFAGIALLSTFAVACAKKDAGTEQGSGMTAATAAQSFDKSAEAAAVRSQDDVWASAIAAGDLDSVMSLYADDAVSMSNGAPAAKGKAAVRESYAEFLKAKPRDITLTSGDASFSDDGTVAYESGSFTGTLDGPGGKPAKMAGDYLAVWKKDGGVWKIVVEVSNSTLPPAG